MMLSTTVFAAWPRPARHRSRLYVILSQILWREHGPPVPEWASEQRAELMEDWDLCSRMQTPKKIALTELTPRPRSPGSTSSGNGTSVAASRRRST
jgi:hypothetical protein